MGPSQDAPWGVHRRRWIAEYSPARSEDRLEELKRFLAGDDPAIAGLLAEMADDEVNLLTVWARQPNSLRLPREIALRFEQVSDRGRRLVARKARLWAAYEEAAQELSFAFTDDDADAEPMTDNRPPADPGDP